MTSPTTAPAIGAFGAAAGCCAARESATVIAAAVRASFVTLTDICASRPSASTRGMPFRCGDGDERYPARRETLRGFRLHRVGASARTTTKSARPASIASRRGATLVARRGLRRAPPFFVVATRQPPHAPLQLADPPQRVRRQLGHDDRPLELLLSHGEMHGVS